MTNQEMQAKIQELIKEISDEKLRDLLDYTKMLVEMENSDKAIQQKLGRGFGNPNIN